MEYDLTQFSNNPLAGYPNSTFNEKIVPELLKLGVSKDNIEKAAKLFVDFYELGYANGAWDEYHGINDKEDEL